MATDVKKRKIEIEKEFELSDEDKKLQEDLLQLVEDITEYKTLPPSLSKLKKLMRISTTSMTAVPKPLKYLRGSYEKLKKAHEKMPKKTDPASAQKLADIISVLALAGAPTGTRECLDYCLKGTLENPGDWGHEYVSRLQTEIVEEWSVANEQEIENQLLPLIKKILNFEVKNNAEIQGCDLCLEINHLELLKDCLDENNYSRVCQYLVSTADYTEDLERREILKTVISHYFKFNQYPKAMLVAMQLPDDDLVFDCFTKCKDPLVRKQLAFIISRLKNQPLRKSYRGEDASDIETILSNGHINGYFQVLAHELEILEPKTPEEIYKSWLETGYGRILEYDSARANLAASFASAFVHTGFGQDKIMSNTEQCWVYKNKEHGMLSATASLGLIHMWDVDGGLVPIDKFLYASEDLVRSGALLAIGLVNVGVKNECDPAMALLSDQVMAPSQNLRIGAILGLGLAYAASRRTDLNDLLMKPLVDKQSSIEIVALSALALGLVNVGSGNTEVSSEILQKLLDLSPDQLSSSHSRFLPLALGLIYMGHRENIEAVIAALDALAEPYKLPAQTMVQVCSYAATGDVLIVQELLRICSEPVENDGDLKKSSSSVNRGPNSAQSGKDSKTKTVEPPSEIALTQPIASFGVAVVGLSDGRENSRIFGQIGRYGSGPARKAVPLCFALSYLSNPDPALLDVLNKYSHDNDTEVSLNAIFSLGLISAGTNNSRVATMLRQLAAYYSKSPTHLFLIRISQGLVHMGKGTLTLQPLKYSSKVLDQASLAGLLITLVSFLDCTNLILGKSHYLMYCLALAIEPRWLVTLDENLELLPVSVRVGQAVDVIGKAGDPKSITGGHVHTSPVLMSYREKAELVNSEEYTPLADPMEGFVILKAKTEQAQA